MKKLCFLILFYFLSYSPIYAQIITTVAGGVTGHAGYWGDGGPATDAQLGIFGSLAVDRLGNIYVADGNNQRVRKVDYSSGIISTVAGTGVGGYSGDGLLATIAEVDGPNFVCLDKTGNFYIIDANNYRIRKVNIATGIIENFAGNGTVGYSVDGTPATAAACDFQSFTFDVSGNMIIQSRTSHRFRKVDASGLLKTIAGSGLPGCSGDGGAATSATMSPVTIGIGVDKLGNIYFADSCRSVRKVNVSTGIITRVAGTGDLIGYPYSGENGPATDAHISPIAIAVDDTGNLYIADAPNSRITKVDTFGIIRTIAGTGVNGYSGDGGIPTMAKLNYPENVVLDSCNNVYIADFNNARVRKITYHSSCDPSLSTKNIKSVTNISIYPNPVTDLLIVEGVQKSTTYSILNMLGSVVQEGNLKEGNNNISVKGLAGGVYVIKITNSEGEQTVSKIIKQ